MGNMQASGFKSCLTGVSSLVWLKSAADSLFFFLVKDTIAVIMLSDWLKEALTMFCFPNSVARSVSTQITMVVCLGEGEQRYSNRPLLHGTYSYLIECVRLVFQTKWGLLGNELITLTRHCGAKWSVEALKKQLVSVFWPDIRAESLGANLLSQPPFASSKAGWAGAAGWLSACYLNNVVSK